MWASGKGLKIAFSEDFFHKSKSLFYLHFLALHFLRSIELVSCLARSLARPPAPSLSLSLSLSPSLPPSLPHTFCLATGSLH